jgi:hypothetical protein
MEEMLDGMVEGEDGVVEGEEEGEDGEDGEMVAGFDLIDN